MARPAKFMKEALKHIGNSMRSVTVACQEALCLDQVHNCASIPNQAQVLVPQAMTGLCAQCRRVELIDSEAARKFVIQPETALVVGRALICGVSAMLSDGHIRALGDFLTNFIDAILVLLSRPSIRDTQHCERFKKHIEAS
ncbi:hypothetical protein C8Q75DRAFT_809895 [Abortiporus biennis]|nr:hypothetical protein C8Q75DRAFT_809895 [Abortiporus biennis]